MSLRMHKHLASLTIGLLILCVAVLSAIASDVEIPGLTQAINAGSAAEKIGFIGTLIVFVFLLIGVLGYLIRALMTKGLAMLESNKEALVATSESNKTVASALQEFSATIRDCNKR